MAALAHGVATVHELGPDSYELSITASDVPVPSTLHTTPIRHAYVAWAVLTPLGRAGGLKRPRGRLVPVPLHATSTFTYMGTGSLLTNHVPDVIITAEVSAMVRVPATPFWSVLVGRS